ncbi:GNAT family N-acetyltransferase [Plantibacter flavus]|uniref:GNAT family N-acetyltransferase n=1 Tax=Plantibacter flavus TaxID=150123 RepID=UPI003F5CC109
MAHRIALRPYTEADAAGTLAIFLAAITETASADYSTEQVEAWAAPRERDAPSWNVSMAARDSFVATIDGALAGFSDVDSSGYIDMMFVSPRFLRQGVASELIAEAERRARAAGTIHLSADVSITARPFFEHHGFVVEAEQHPVRRGIKLTNYLMRRQLEP